MKSNVIAKDADALLAAAEDVAAVLSERRDEFGMGIGAEAALRAGISAAEFSINAYLEILAGSERSALAGQYLPEAKARCDRSLKQLRRRVLRSIGELRRHTNERQIQRIAEYVRSLST